MEYFMPLDSTGTFGLNKLVAFQNMPFPRNSSPSGTTDGSLDHSAWNPSLPPYCILFPVLGSAEETINIEAASYVSSKTLDTYHTEDRTDKNLLKPTKNKTSPWMRFYELLLHQLQYRLHHQTNITVGLKHFIGWKTTRISLYFKVNNMGI